MPKAIRHALQVVFILLAGTLLIGQDCLAQTGLCDPDPCVGIPNAVAGTCAEVVGPCSGAPDYFCSCDAEHTWQAATHTCTSSPPTCEGVVNFPDPGLEQKIRDAISKPTGDIYATDLLGLTTLYASNTSISDLSGLECCTGLEVLGLAGNQIDISPLASLTNLTELDLSHNQIVDVSPLAGLTNLTWLSLEVNQIVDVSPLAGLTNLTTLSIHTNQIVDVSPLSGLTNLTSLYLNLNEIVDVCPLVDNLALDSGDSIYIQSNPLSTTSCTVCVPQLEARGVSVGHDCP